MVSRRNAAVSRETTSLRGDLSGVNELLAREDALWKTELGKNRHTTKMPTKLLHVHENLEATISDEKELYEFTSQGDFVPKRRPNL